MINDFTLRPAALNDVPEIIRLMIEDELGATRESLANPLAQSYFKAFQEIADDKNHSLLIVELKGKIIGTCHLTFMPSLSFKGSKRLNIENVHIDKHFQSQGIGTWMLQKAILIGKEKGCKIVQLTTNKKRNRAKGFYEKLGFKASHEGLKLYVDQGHRIKIL
jgi:ribosomal protein S18 acetylase RimI-like enzyme